MEKLVIEKRVDGAYFNTTISKYYLIHSRYGANALIFDDNLPFRLNFRKLSSVKYPKIIKQFNQFLLERKVDLNNLKIKYGLIKETTEKKDQ